MKVTTLYVFGIGLALCAAAADAQQYKWKDSRGRTVYGDVPPAGVQAVPLRSVPTPPAATPTNPAGTETNAKAGAKPGAKDGKPLTPAEQEMEFRRRVKEAQENAAKKAKEDEAERDKKQNCELAREQERTLINQPRIARTNEKGERYYMDDDQRAQALAKTRQSVADWCK
jgi:hypothetical protein